MLKIKFECEAEGKDLEPLTAALVACLGQPGFAGLGLQVASKSPATAVTLGGQYGVIGDPAKWAYTPVPETKGQDVDDILKADPSKPPAKPKKAKK